MGGESQIPSWKWEQQARDIEGVTGPAIDETQSTEEQSSYKRATVRL